MQVIADTHVHLYEAYNLAASLRALGLNLAQHATDDEFQLIACLTERHNGDVFTRLRGLRDLEGMAIDAGESAESLVIRLPQPVTLFAGHQVITRERIEILSLVCATRIPDGLSSTETLQSIRAAQGVPILPWSPGKWLGPRGKIVRALLESSDAAALGVGDTAMRPAGVPEPGFFGLARTHGHRVLAGTDPLPFAQDAAIMGTYASVWTPTRDPALPLGAEAFREMLRREVSTLSGRRNTLARAVQRWVRNARTTNS